MRMTFRLVPIAVALVMSSGSWAVSHPGAQSGGDGDTFEPSGAEPRPLPDDAVEMVVDTVVDSDTLHLTYKSDGKYDVIATEPERDAKTVDNGL